MFIHDNILYERIKLITYLEMGGNLEKIDLQTVRVPIFKPLKRVVKIEMTKSPRFAPIFKVIFDDGSDELFNGCVIDVEVSFILNPKYKNK